MTSSKRAGWGAAAAAAVLGVSLIGLGFWADERVAAAPPPAYDLVPLPAGVDSLTSLADLARGAGVCGPACSGIVYLWTPRMPLSRSGIPNVVEAARALGLRIALTSTEDLQEYAEGGHPSAAGISFADAMLEAGVLAHAPALVVHAGGDVIGTAILGYKSADAYASLVSSRLAEGASGGGLGAPTPFARLAVQPADPQAPADYEAVGLPGAYFRWVPGTRLLAYESDRSIYFLDLADGENRIAPGWIDFVPSPDGRYFVTPGPGDGGLTFFDGREVLEATERGRSMAVEPIFTDLRMRDQYPSVGILEQGESRTLYRVLTSWFEGLMYRDYEVRVNPATGASSVRPVGEPIVPCAGYALSTPIMSQTGHEVAARDETTGTTKVFEILEGQSCREVLDLGAATSKVAWHASGQKLAFATPRRGRGSSGGEGIFVFDRQTGTTTSVPGSGGASRLAFPDFVGDESVVFLVPAAPGAPTSVFRVVDGIQ
ncbi:MAG: hypothetical protein EXR91_02795 [Gemmatimonadetes bacterium]|nr:hypothetical protein [Gemmatimonadota bacterium]